MTTLVQDFDVHSPEAGISRPVELHQPIDSANVNSISGSWTPLLDRQASIAQAKYKLSGSNDRSVWNGILQALECPDARWDWSTIADPSKMGSAYTSFCICAEGDVQAAMVLDMTRRCRQATQTGEHMVYIDYLATAPWNRKALRNPIKYQGLGTVLLGVAVQASIDEGWNGRTGLHSLPQSEGFYSKHGMELIGIDPHKENLMYCEFTKDGAEQFLK